MTALPLTDKIIQTAQKTVRFTTITAQFGDGYMLRATDGINSKQEDWSITYDNLEQTERDLIWVFIDLVKQADVIEWTAPGDLTEKNWIIDPESDVTEQAKTGDIYTIGFTLKRVFDF
jgi:phage-related protein